MSPEQPVNAPAPRRPPPIPAASRAADAGVVIGDVNGGKSSTDGGRATGAQAAAMPEGHDRDDETTDGGRVPIWILTLVSGTAAGYYLSIAVHIVGYVTAATLFYLYSTSDYFDRDKGPVTINASLSDEEVEADRAKLEITQTLEPGNNKDDSTIQRIASGLRHIDKGNVESVLGESLPSTFSNSDINSGDDGGNFLFKLPESGMAVTKGSFTAWTVPDVPQTDEAYMIIIEVRLPDDVVSYRVSDLQGNVRGSDGYRQTIPFDSNARFASFYTNEEKKLENISGTEVIKVRNNKIQLAIRVPGAKKLVRDVIEIRSRRLRENQQLELVFGSE